MTFINEWLDNPLDLSNPVSIILLILFFYLMYQIWKKTSEGLYENYKKLKRAETKKKKKK